MVKSILVVNMRGTINISSDVKQALNDLNISRRFNATIIPDTPSYRGMLQKTKDHVSWCESSPSVIKKMLELRGKVEGWKPIKESDVDSIGVSNLDELAENLSNSKMQMNKISFMKPRFHLCPPKGGFKKSTRRHYRQGGILGENPELIALIEKML